MNTYTGVPGNIGALSPVTTSIPADGADPLNAASVNTALQKLTDYVAFVPTVGAGMLVFGGSVGNVAAVTAYFISGGGANGTPCPTTNSIANSTVALLANSYYVRGLYVWGTTNLVGGSVTVTVRDGTTNTTATLTIAAGNGSAVSFIVPGTPTQIFAGHQLDVQVVTNAGLTTGLGATIVGVLLALG